MIVKSFIFFVNLLSLSFGVFNNKKFDEKVFALIKVMEYMKERPQQMNADTTLGVIFSEVNLLEALNHPNALRLKTFRKDFLEKTLILVQETRNILFSSENLRNKDVVKLRLSIYRPKIWKKPITWKKIIIEESNFTSSTTNFSINEVERSMFKGHPEAKESDKCLLDLIDRCELSTLCRKFVANDNIGSKTGYPLTHRLLIKQTNNALQCNTSISRFSSYLGYNLCYLILRDLKTWEIMGFPGITKDLALEQIFLCGMEGYLDFINDHYEKLILSWQHDSGCYPAFNEFQNRCKRAGDFTDFFCINHTTGLAAATLALMLRNDVETMTNFQQNF